MAAPTVQVQRIDVANTITPALTNYIALYDVAPSSPGAGQGTNTTAGPTAQTCTVQAFADLIEASALFPLTLTGASANALAVGLTGATNPAFNVDTSTSSQAAGLNVVGATAAGTVAVAVISSGSNANLSLNAKGSGTIAIAGTSTGTVSVGRALTVANTITVSAGGMDVTGQAGFGASQVANTGVRIGGSVTASSATAFGSQHGVTLIAAANSDVLAELRIAPAFTPASFTGLVARGAKVEAFSVAAFTTPGDVAGIEVGIVTGTGATNGYGLLLGVPTGASNNYLLAATTASIFSVSAAGALTSSSSLRSTSPTAGIGYSTGAGGAQTQATDKATTVVSNTITTAITMNNATLNAGVIVAFTFTNSSIAATDTVLVTHESVGTSGAYLCNAFPGVGSAVISVRNTTAGNLGEAIVLRVTVVKSVSA